MNKYFNIINFGLQENETVVVDIIGNNYNYVLNLDSTIRLIDFDYFCELLDNGHYHNKVGTLKYNIDIDEYSMKKLIEKLEDLHKKLNENPYYFFEEI